MKRLAMTAALLLAGASGVMATSTNNQNITIDANVPLFCTLDTPSLTAVSFTSNGNGTVANPAAPSTMTVLCNSNSNVTLTSTKGAVTYLATEAAADAVVLPPNFRNKIEYTAVASGAGMTTQTLDTSLVSTTGAVPLATGAVSGTLSITIAQIANANLLVASSGYSDTLNVVVTAIP